MTQVETCPGVAYVEGLSLPGKAAALALAYHRASPAAKERALTERLKEVARRLIIAETSSKGEPYAGVSTLLQNAEVAKAEQKIRAITDPILRRNVIDWAAEIFPAIDLKSALRTGLIRSDV